MFRWITSFAGSLIINALLLIGGAFYLNFAAPEANEQPEPILMEIVSDDAAPAAGPQISAPKPEKVDIPPPPTKEEIAQMVKSNADTIPVDNKVTDDMPKPPVPTPQQTGNPTQSTTETKGGGGGGNTDNPEGEGNGGGGGPKEDKSQGPRRLSTPTPSIPAIPREQAVGDSVTAYITIAADGSVSDVSLSSSTGYGPADDAIISTVYGWSFYPATDEDGNPISVTVPQNFGLEIK